MKKTVFAVLVVMFSLPLMLASQNPPPPAPGTNALADYTRQITNAFSIEQDGQTISGTSTSIKNFVNGKVPAGQRIDGIVEFSKKVDISKPFTVKNGTTGAVQ